MEVRAFDQGGRKNEKAKMSGSIVINSECGGSKVGGRDRKKKESGEKGEKGER